MVVEVNIRLWTIQYRSFEWFGCLLLLIITKSTRFDLGLVDNFVNVCFWEVCFCFLIR